MIGNKNANDVRYNGGGDDVLEEVVVICAMEGVVVVGEFGVLEACVRWTHEELCDFNVAISSETDEDIIVDWLTGASTLSRLTALRRPLLHVAAR